MKEFLYDTDKQGIGFRVKSLEKEKIKNRSEVKM